MQTAHKNCVKSQHYEITCATLEELKRLPRLVESNLKKKLCKCIRLRAPMNTYFDTVKIEIDSILSQRHDRLNAGLRKNCLS